MSDEFDSPDASEKAAVEYALNNPKQPSDDAVQTEPVKCRYTKSGICAIRVNFRDGNETTAYYTDNFEDAVNAVVAMARKRAFSGDSRADRIRGGLTAFSPPAGVPQTPSLCLARSSPSRRRPSCA